MAKQTGHGQYRLNDIFKHLPLILCLSIFSNKFIFKIQRIIYKIIILNDAENRNKERRCIISLLHRIRIAFRPPQDHHQGDKQKIT